MTTTNYYLISNSKNNISRQTSENVHSSTLSEFNKDRLFFGKGINYDNQNHSYQLQPLDSHIYSHIDSQLNSHIDNRGLAYGDGFFSTMGIYQGQILWADYHHKRLMSHANALQFQLNTQAIMQHLINIAQQIDEGIIKIIICRQPQNVKGYGFMPSPNLYQREGSSLPLRGRAREGAFNHQNNTEIFIKATATPMPAYSQTISKSSKEPTQENSKEKNINMSNPLIKELQNPLPSLNHIFAQLVHLSDLPHSAIPPIQPMGEAICLQSQICCYPKLIAGLKSLSRLDSVMVAGELERIKLNHSTTPNRSNIVEGLVSDVSNNNTNNNHNSNNRNWVEGVISNVFYQLDSDKVSGNNSYDNSYWYTPPIEHSGVNGVMRQVLIDASIKAGQPVQERKLNDTDLTKLSALFFCNAVQGIIPINRLHL